MPRKKIQSSVEVELWRGRNIIVTQFGLKHYFCSEVECFVEHDWVRITYDLKNHTQPVITPLKK